MLHGDSKEGTLRFKLFDAVDLTGAITCFEGDRLHHAIDGLDLVHPRRFKVSRSLRALRGQICHILFGYSEYLEQVALVLKLERDLAFTLQQPSARIELVGLP